jgi:predicted hydrocarbon binding protein
MAQHAPSARFCDCSAGFEKQYWDAVLDQPVAVDVVKSALQGDLVCEFAVHLPDDVVRADRSR